jgi:small subunit ribosomal protein S9
MSTNTTKKSTKKEGVYYEGVGRRKTAVARVRISKTTQKPQFLVGEVDSDSYFKTEELRKSVKAPLEATAQQEAFDITVHLTGGGQRGQAEAVQLGLSRALVKFNEEFQRTLRDLDYLKRDPRSKERKKYGLKKARRSPQWSKR